MPVTINATSSARNDEWITESTIPDPDPLPVPCGDNLIIRPVSIRNKTKSGIVLPDAFKDDIQSLTTVGRILAVSKLSRKQIEEEGSDEFNVGDYVAYPKFAGAKFKYKNVALILLKHTAVCMKVEDPRNLDPMYNLSN